MLVFGGREIRKISLSQSIPRITMNLPRVHHALRQLESTRPLPAASEIKYMPSRPGCTRLRVERPGHGPQARDEGNNLWRDVLP